MIFSINLLYNVLMKKKTILKKEDILHLAKLANLTISEEKITKFQNQLSEIIDYFNKLKEIDTEKVEPTNQVTGLQNVLREDVTSKERILHQEEALKNAPKKKNGYFQVKAIFNN